MGKFYFIFTLWDGGVVECGDGWFSKITSGIRVNALQICIDHGYKGTITKYGGNSGIQCQHSTSGGGGALTDFGYTVSWKCEFEEGKLYVPEQLNYRYVYLKFIGMEILAGL